MYLLFFLRKCASIHVNFDLSLQMFWREKKLQMKKWRWWIEVGLYNDVFHAFDLTSYQMLIIIIIIV